MTYKFKPLDELVWVGVVAVGVYALQLLVVLDLEEVAGNWQTYVIAAASGIVRAGAAAMLAKMGR